MSDRTSHIFDGAGDGLVKAYTSGITGVSSACQVEPYDHVNVYLAVSSVVAVGTITVSCDFSDDGTNWCVIQQVAAAGALDYSYTKLGPSSTNGAPTGLYCTFPNAGKFARIRIAYSSGTSLTISRAIIEGKS